MKTLVDGWLCDVKSNFKASEPQKENTEINYKYLNYKTFYLLK